MTAGVFFLSCFINLAFFAVPLYTIQVSERALTSRNVLTLLFLTIITIVILGFSALIEALRSRILQASAADFDVRTSGPLFNLLGHRTEGKSLIEHQVAVNDLNTLREFIGGSYIPSFMDALFSPLFLLAMFVIHPLLGLLTLGFLVVLVLLSVINQAATLPSSKRAQEAGTRMAYLTSAVARAAEDVRVMGMLRPLQEEWSRRRLAMLGWQSSAGLRSTVVLGIIRFLRQSQQILAIALAAYLIIHSEVSTGALFAAMILVGRCTGPIEAVVGGWRQMSGATLAFRRLDTLFEKAATEEATVSLPRPEGRVAVDRVYVSAGSSQATILSDVSFTLRAGRVLCVIGQSGAGKSTLARVLVGSVKPRRGTVALGDDDLSHWNTDELGRFVGFMPQQIEFLPGTVAENIARFEAPSPDRDKAVVEAVTLANVRDLVRSLPEGFNTRVGPDEMALSSGQKQRLALARAVYRKPALVVLDEPNANLDAQGEKNLAETLQELRRQEVTVVVITHRMNMLAYCDDVLVLNGGTVHAFGPKEFIMNRMPNVTRSGPGLTVIEGNAPPKAVAERGATA